MGAGLVRKHGEKWTAFEEPYICALSEGKTLELSTTGIKRDSYGFTMTHESAGYMGEFEIFKCTGAFGEFKFEASRRDTPEDEPSDTYKVYLFYKNYDNTMIRVHAKNIESALLNFPILRYFKNIPVKKVVFTVGDVKNYKLVTAGEVING